MSTHLLRAQAPPDASEHVPAQVSAEEPEIPRHLQRIPNSFIILVCQERSFHFQRFALKTRAVFNQAQFSDIHISFGTSSPLHYLPPSNLCMNNL